MVNHNTYVIQIYSRVYLVSPLHTTYWQDTQPLCFCLVSVNSDCFNNKVIAKNAIIDYLTKVFEMNKNIFPINSTGFTSFEVLIKTKLRRLTNICHTEKRTKHSSVLLLRLLHFSAWLTLLNIGRACFRSANKTLVKQQRCTYFSIKSRLMCF